MGTLEQKWGPNGDPKTEKGPHGDRVPQMGTHVGTVRTDRVIPRNPRGPQNHPVVPKQEKARYHKMKMQSEI